jgi:hypothetical protein
MLRALYHDFVNLIVLWSQYLAVQTNLVCPCSSYISSCVAYLIGGPRVVEFIEVQNSGLWSYESISTYRLKSGDAVNVALYEKTMPNATIHPHQQRLPPLLFCRQFACRVVYTVTGAAEVAQPSHVPGHVASVHPQFFLYRAFISASYFLKMTSRFIFMVGVSSPFSTWGKRDPQLEARRDPLLDSSTSLHLPKPVYGATRVLGKVVYDLRIRKISGSHLRPRLQQASKGSGNKSKADGKFQRLPRKLRQRW